MPATYRLITVKPTPGSVDEDVSVSWVMPWEVRGSEDQEAIELPISDPVTTEAFGPRWCLASEMEALYERHNTPTPRLWSGRVKT
jgi:hypothetical protein